MRLNKITKKAFKASKNKGFWDSRYRISENIRNLDPLSPNDGFEVVEALRSRSLLLIVSELTEAMEALRGNRYANSDAFNKSIEEGTDFQSAFEVHMKDTFEDELADAAIRLFDFAYGSRVNLEKHIKLKMKYNSMREHMHGKKF